MQSQKIVAHQEMQINRVFRRQVSHRQQKEQEEVIPFNYVQ